MSFEQIRNSKSTMDTCGCILDIRTVHTLEFNPKTNEVEWLGSVSEATGFYRQCEFHKTPQEAHADNMKKNDFFELQEALIEAEQGKLQYILQEVRVKDGVRQVLREDDRTNENRGLAKGVTIKLSIDKEPEYILFGHTPEEIAILEKADFGDTIVKKQDGSLIGKSLVAEEISIKKEVLKNG